MGLIFSVLAAVEGIHLETSGSFCGGGLGHLLDFFLYYGALGPALLATLVALGFAVVFALRGHRWTWIVGLVMATMASVLITVGSDSQVSRTLVGSVLGFDCSIVVYPQVVQSFVPLLVAAPTFACLITGRRYTR
jgi:hypothetical protein